MILSTLTLGAVFALMALGVHLSYKLLNFPDLTVDGSFPLGAAICAASMTLGLPVAAALPLSLIGGLMAGALTGLLHTRLKLTDLLSGILVMIGLYSLNLRIMGRPNLPLIGLSHPFQGQLAPLYLGLILLAFKLALDFFYKTRLGMLIKATGENPVFVTHLGLNPDHYKVLGLMIANGLVSTAGALMALTQGFADIGMGLGMMVAGLAAVIIGERFFGSVILGSLVYRALISIAFAIGIAPGDIKLLTAVLMALVLSPVLKDKLSQSANLSYFKRRNTHAQMPQPSQEL